MKSEKLPAGTPVWIDGIDQTPVGPVSVAVTSKGLISIDFCKVVDLEKTRVKWVRAIQPPPELLGTALTQIAGYLRGERQIFTLEIDWRVMTDFQEKVLRLVNEIPYGEIRTYNQLAHILGKPGAQRAVGGANARNPMPIVIPCHRVIGADGGLHGYSAADGLKTKAWLLKLEGSIL
jgi:O-6-methylguanine DNA methyltransferase